VNDFAQKTKADFPLFAEYPELVYLDNAATTQKPQAVIDSLVDFYTKHNANVHRGLYPLSEQATELYEGARAKLARFLNAATEEIIFTSGTTEGMNFLAGALPASGLVPVRPRVVISAGEHHSTLLPWQQVASELLFMPLNDNFTLEVDGDGEDAYGQAAAAGSADIIALSLINNVTGALADLHAIRARFPNSIIIVDGAQAIGHAQLDLKNLPIDFLVASGHKMYGPTGIGIMYGRKELLDQLPPQRVGGGMIRKVERENSTWAPLPERLEAGTPSIADAIAMGTAADYILSLGWDKISAHQSALSRYAFDRLTTIPGLTLYHPREVEQHGGVFSFSIEGLHPHDLAQLLGEKNVAVRAGHHCVQILHRELLKIPASTRASLAVYNDETDIDKLITAIEDAKMAIL
jgi:cysteine desulfurase/selenocysteine lyase